MTTVSTPLDDAKPRVRLGSSNAWAFAILAGQLSFTAMAIALSMSGQPVLWVVGQVLLAVNLFQWFVIHHDLAHGAFFRTRILNDVAGHLSSIFCLMPYFSWKQVHHHHHIWTGWKDKDPSDPLSQIKAPSPRAAAFMNFCWKYWIPVFALGFVAINFWNLKRVNRLFPDPASRARSLFSVVWLVSVYVVALSLMPGAMLRYGLPALLLFLMISDPILLTQHVHIDAHMADGQRVKAFRYSEQGAYARNVKYPAWVAKWFFYNSERHGLHHLHPEIPIYRLGKLPSPHENNIGWSEWLHLAKSLPADVLIFKTASETGVRL